MIEKNLKYNVEQTYWKAESLRSGMEATREIVKCLDFMLHAVGMGLEESFENNYVIQFMFLF